MIFSLKTAFFLSLVVNSLAAPLSVGHFEDISQLERRLAGVVPSSVTCGTDRFGRPVVIPRSRIINALNAADTPAKSSRNKEYPAYYGNKNGQLNVLTDASALAAQARRELREQPVGTTDTWTGGDLKYVGASMYRVIYDNSIMDPEQSYIGMVYHQRDEEGAFLACVEAADAACPPPSTKRGLWELISRAVGKKPAPKPAKCRKPAPKQPAPKKPVPKKPAPSKPASNKAGSKKPAL